jgi:hypothetical protein
MDTVTQQHLILVAKEFEVALVISHQQCLSDHKSSVAVQMHATSILLCGQKLYVTLCEFIVGVTILSNQNLQGWLNMQVDVTDFEFISWQQITALSSIMVGSISTWLPGSWRHEVLKSKHYADGCFLAGKILS